MKEPKVMIIPNRDILIEVFKDKIELSYDGTIVIIEKRYFERALELYEEKFGDK